MMLMPSCKQFAATGGIHEVSADDNDYLKVIADARLKMEKPTVPVMPCTLGSQCWREHRACDTLFDTSDNVESRHRRKRT